MKKILLLVIILCWFSYIHSKENSNKDNVAKKNENTQGTKEVTGGYDPADLPVDVNPLTKFFNMTGDSLKVDINYNSMDFEKEYKSFQKELNIFIKMANQNTKSKKKIDLKKKVLAKSIKLEFKFKNKHKIYYDQLTGTEAILEFYNIKRYVESISMLKTNVKIEKMNFSERKKVYKKLYSDMRIKKIKMLDKLSEKELDNMLPMFKFNSKIVSGKIMEEKIVKKMTKKEGLGVNTELYIYKNGNFITKDQYAKLANFMIIHLILPEQKVNIGSIWGYKKKVNLGELTLLNNLFLNAKFRLEDIVMYNGKKCAIIKGIIKTASKPDAKYLKYNIKMLSTIYFDINNGYIVDSKGFLKLKANLYTYKSRKEINVFGVDAKLNMRMMERK